MNTEADNRNIFNDLCIVYPTCGRPDLLIKSISMLWKNSVLPGQIIVIDQSQCDTTKVALSKLNNKCIIHIPSTEKGLSRARNLGIQSSQAPLIGFLDDDCMPFSDWVSNIQTATEDHAKSHVWIGEDIHVKDDVPEYDPLDRIVYEFSFSGKNDPWRIGPTGGNSVFRRSAFDDVGLFDPLLGQGSDFPGAEDGDMIYRVMKNNLKVTFTNTIQCFHLDWRNGEQEIRNGYNYGLGVGAMLAKFFYKKDFYPMTTILLQRFIIKFLKVPLCLITGDKFGYRQNLKWSQGIIKGFCNWPR